MGVPWLAVQADVRRHTVGIGQPPSEPLRQGGLLLTGEATWQGCIDFTCHHGIGSTVTGFDPIPESLALDGGHAGGQEQGKRRHVLLGAEIGHNPGPQIHQPRGRPVGRCRHRRPAFRPPYDGHLQVEQRWG